MLDRSKTLRHTLIASAVAATVSMPSHAQDSLALEEVIVTAQKRAESLQDTPISVAAFAQEELEAIGAFEAGQVAEYTANLSIDRQPSSLDNYGYSWQYGWNHNANQTQYGNNNTEYNFQKN